MATMWHLPSLRHAMLWRGTDLAIEFDPYHRWLGISPHEQPPNLYRLLGIALFESDLDVIATAADRQMAHLRTFQTGPHGALSQKMLNEIAAARVCLLNPAKRQAYDEQLRRSLTLAAPPQVVPPPVHNVQELQPSSTPLAIRQAHRPARSKPRISRLGVLVATSVSLIAVVVIAVWIAYSNQQDPLATVSQHTRPSDAATSKSTSFPRVEGRSAAARSTTRKPSVSEGSAAIPSATPNPDQRSDAKENSTEPTASATATPPGDAAAAANSQPPLPQTPTPTIEKSLPSVADPGMTKAQNNVLADLDLDNDRVAGEWQLIDGAVMVSPQPNARLMLPVTVAGDYDFQLEFTREAGDDSVVVFLPAGNRACTVAFSEFHGEVHGLEMIDGKSGRENSAAMRPGTLTNGVRHTAMFRMRVRNGQIDLTVLLDGVPQIHWTGPQESLAVYPAWQLPDETRLGLGAMDAKVVFHRASVHLVSGELRPPKRSAGR